MVAIDHPYDANAVEMADGHLVLRNQPDTEAAAARAVEVRVDDTRFVLGRLPALRTDLRLPLDPHRVGMFGHSMEGATAASAMLADRRILAGVTLDGRFFGPVIDRGLDRPFLHLATLLPPGQLKAMVGTIDGLRAAEIQQTYLTAYFDRFLRHRPAPLLNGPDQRYPEVLFQP